MDDREIAVMAQLNGLLSELDDRAQERVVQWLIARYPARRIPIVGQREDGAGRQPSDFASLMESADFETEEDRTLLACFWVQEFEGANPFDSQRVNTLLKELGFGASNITRALRGLHEQRPRLVMPIRKEGRTRQARKQYRVTGEGIRHARQIAHLA